MPIQTVESRISYLIAKAKTEDITYDELKDLQTILNRLLDFVDEEVINHFNFRQGVADLSKCFEGVEQV